MTYDLALLIARCPQKAVSNTTMLVCKSITKTKASHSLLRGMNKQKTNINKSICVCNDVLT